MKHIHQLSDENWQRWLESHDDGLRLVLKEENKSGGSVCWMFDVPAEDLISTQFFGEM